MTDKDWNTIEAELQAAVYQATRVYEDLEHQGRITGNGHHMRGEIVDAAIKLLRERRN